MINTNLNIKNNNNNATASTDCVSEYLFCAQYFKNRGQKNSLSRFSKFQSKTKKVAFFMNNSSRKKNSEQLKEFKEFQNRWPPCDFKD